MSFLNVFRTKAEQTFIDPLEQAHTSVARALDVFTVAKRGLEGALQHFAEVTDDADEVIGHYQARRAEAQAAADNSAKVLDKIDALLS